MSFKQWCVELNDGHIMPLLGYGTAQNPQVTKYIGLGMEDLKRKSTYDVLEPNSHFSSLVFSFC